ncbi:nitrate ABC transporter substrate-binding protein, partial [Burkholderia sp. Se-20378]|nr:nitrate ABC transporter substrate-binding protein [Burkholderia sp. Se-20378]
FLSQYRRWGMLDGSHDDAGIARAIAQTALYDAAVAESGAAGLSQA